ncbi:uncharacterized protein EI90DRAFT_3115393 [Cantharellus anzutake]|uniref:uncharacterized protein n=1 Tax=Cantharellus anzutake TaxID=1750568 RepID=UPI001903EB29|nr:uncharacterized protein EI90DRAFT_3115393 [Cantharellus anzutake]KAF8342856.1 hypothetical protein EI90DRAFT_3115393 [Cantharellus anzutake]
MSKLQNACSPLFSAKEIDLIGRWKKGSTTSSRKCVHKKIAQPRGCPDRVKGGFHLAEAMGIEKHEMTLESVRSALQTHLGKAFHNGMVQLQKLDYKVLWQIQNDVIAEHPWIKSDYEGAWPIQELIRTVIGNCKTGIQRSKQRKVHVGGSVKRISRSTNEADEDHTELDKDCGGSDADRESDEDRSGLNEEPTGTDEDCNESDDSGRWGGTPQTRRKGTESTKQSSAHMMKHSAKVDHPIKEPTGLHLCLHLNSKNAHDIVNNEGHPHASYYDNDNDSDNPTSGAEIEGGFMSATNEALWGKGVSLNLSFVTTKTYVTFSPAHSSHSFGIARALPRKTAPLDEECELGSSSKRSRELHGGSDGNRTCTKPGKGT